MQPSLSGFAKLALNGWVYTTLFTPKSQDLEDFSAIVSAYNEKYFGVNMTGWYTSSYTEPLYDAIYLFAHAATRVLEAGEMRKMVRHCSRQWRM